MPYDLIRQPNGKWALVKKTTGKKVAESDTRNMAEKAIVARMANEKKGGEGK